jgi:hypothetical protein
MPGARNFRWRRRMKIEVLYSPGCPNYIPAVEQVERVLSSESVQAGIRTVAVRTDAEAWTG